MDDEKDVLDQYLICRYFNCMTSATTESKDRIFLGQRTDLPDGTRLIVSVPGDEVGVIVHEGQIHAYRNRCGHQGGPVCEGMIIGKVEARLSEDGRMLGEVFSDTEPHLVCPWHGVEYLLADGQCVTNPRMRLRRYEVTVEDDGRTFLITK